MKARTTDAGAVAALRGAALAFGDGSAARKLAALASCARHAIDDPGVLVAYHDCLLCLLAYPETKTLRDAAGAELERVARDARLMFADGPARVRRKLANSGVAWTPVTINFGWDIARWLTCRFARHAEVESFAADDSPLQAILATALPAMEFELAAADETTVDFLDRASHGRRGSRLAWLVAAFEQLPCSDALREHLYEAAGVFIVMESRDSMLSRTFARGLPAPTYYHRDGLIRRVDLGNLLAAPLAPPRRLSSGERAHVVDVGRAMLAALGRETDAIALAYPDGVAWHPLERGVAIALYTMRADRRAPLDSHVGMMIFKNGIPVGYGGGWPFMGTCRIGVNIFAPFRGGESALLFGQVLRVYAQRFRVGRFIAEPSQFGGTNREGLESGAFWFYYRLGFRPIEGPAARLAAVEWARMQSDRAYRTPIAALRRFTGSDIELRLFDVPACEASALSERVSARIGDRHAGDREAAQRSAERSVMRALEIGAAPPWPPAERAAFAALALLVREIPGLARWSRADKRALVALMRAKGGDEFRFHRLLSRHHRLAAALDAIAVADERRKVDTIT